MPSLWLLANGSFISFFPFVRGMAISDLKAGQGKVDITVSVVSISEPRQFEKFGKPGRVATAKVKDETGEISLSLWNDDVDVVKPGDKIKISNGYVNEFRGEIQLSTGRFGKLEVVEKGMATEDDKTEVNKNDKPDFNEDFIE